MTPAANRPRARASLVLAAFVLVLAGPAVEEAKAQSAATVQNCKNAWNSASARPTCSITSGIITVSNGQCGIEVYCEQRVWTAAQGWVTNAIYNYTTVPLGDVGDLHNCDGSLQVGAC